MNKKFPNVLILNRAWVPVQICDYKKAMSLIYQEAAHSLDHDFIAYDFNRWLEFSNIPANNEYPTVSTVSFKIAIPEIIVLKKYDRVPSRDIKYSRESLFATYKNRCIFCGNVFDTKDLTVEHLIPRSKGGKTDYGNVAPACRRCNFLKADKTVEQFGVKLKYKLRTPRWVGPLSHVRHGNIRKSWRKFMDRPLIEGESHE